MSDDSDGYFDNFDIDDDVLQTLQEVEDRYVVSQSQQVRKPPSSPPPAKRPRLDISRPSEAPAHAVTTSIWRGNRFQHLDDDDNPEIVLVGDGRYGFPGQVPPRNAPAPAVGKSNFNKNINSLPPRDAVSPASHTPQNAEAGPSRIVPSQSTSRVLSQSVGQSSGSGRPNPRTSSQKPGSVSTVLSSGPIVSANIEIEVRRNEGAPTRESVAPEAQAELEVLRAQLREVQAAKEATERALREANESKLIREGEAANVRRLMEKQANLHGEAINKLKLEKADAESKRVKLEVDLKAEMDRLKTRLTFRQHELETSARKPAWGAQSSARKPSQPSASQRGVLQFGPTPGPSSSRRPTSPEKPSDWSAGTPSKLTRKSTTTHGSGGKGKAKVKIKIAEPVAPMVPQTLGFPSFHNSFAPGSPVKSPGKGKGKQKMVESTPPATNSRRTVDDEEMEVAVDLGWGDTDAAGGEASHQGSSQPDAPVEMEVDATDEEGEHPNSISWPDELHRLLFTHTFSMRPTVAHPNPPSRLTLHVILSTSLPSTAHPEQLDQYVAACSALLGLPALQHEYRQEEWDAMLETVLSSLMQIIRIFADLGLTAPIPPLLDLFSILSLSLPGVSDLLMAPSDIDDPFSHSHFLDTLSVLIQNHFSPAQDLQNDKGNRKEVNLPRTWSDEQEDLAACTIRVIESLCWNVNETSVGRLGILVQTPRVVLPLLDTSQPSWLIQRVTRLLVILSSHGSLFRPLLGFPNQEGDVAPKDYTRILLLELLCSYLSSPCADMSESQIQTISQSILTFFSMLSNHPDGRTILFESQALIPSVVICLTRLTSRIWEEEEAMKEENYGIMLSMIRTMNSALFLLHHLIYSPTYTPHLAQRLYNASATRVYNGITHMFILCMGRISYADPPDWLGKDAAVGIERITELARDLLDAVVEGPEADTIYQVYQDTEEEERVTVVEEDGMEMAAESEKED